MRHEQVTVKKVEIDYSGSKAEITEKSGTVTLRKGPFGTKIPVGISAIGYFFHCFGNSTNGAVLFDEDITEHKEQEFSKMGAVKLLNYAISHADKYGDLAFSKAMEKFRALGTGGQVREAQVEVIRSMEKALGYHSSFTFESHEKMRGAKVIADFFAAVAEVLPMDKDGGPDTTPYIKALNALARITEREIEAGQSSENEVMLAVTKALWNLGYPAHSSYRRSTYDFWTAMLRESASRPFLVEKFLEMEPCDNSEEHGWTALRENIAIAGIDVARSRSEKKVDFLRSMISDDDRQVVAEAFQSAVYLDKIPADFELEARSRGSFCSMRAGELVVAFGNATRAAAAVQARQMQGMQNLKNVNTGPGLGGIPTIAPAPDPAIVKAEEELARQVEPLNTELAETVSHLSVMQEFLAIAECKRILKHTDEKRFEAIPTLLEIYRQGRPHLKPMIESTMEDVSTILLSPPGETDHVSREYREKAALAFVDLLIVTNPRNGGQARGQMLETLSGMLQHNDDRRFVAANHLIRLGSEGAKYDGFVTLGERAD